MELLSLVEGTYTSFFPFHVSLLGLILMSTRPAFFFSALIKSIFDIGVSNMSHIGYLRVSNMGHIGYPDIKYGLYQG